MLNACNLMTYLMFSPENTDTSEEEIRCVFDGN